MLKRRHAGLTMEREYQYVFFNSLDGRMWEDSKDGYNAICAKDIDDLQGGVQLVQCPLQKYPTILRVINAAVQSERVNRIVKIPRRDRWFSRYFDLAFPENSKLCFVVLGGYVTVDYLRYLHGKYPKARFVKIHRDLQRIWEKCQPEFTEDLMQELFDIRMTFDENEAKQYGLTYFHEYESKVEIGERPELRTDVFFAGKAKDRIGRLIEVYDYLALHGIECSFYITDSDIDQMIKRPGIEYASRPMSYKEMLERTIAARCILEINQSDAVGLTSRFLEAVMYNKKLITDNQEVVNQEFYNPKYMQCIKRAADINVEMIRMENVVDYGYTDEFSPTHLIDQIDCELLAHFGD